MAETNEEATNAWTLPGEKELPIIDFTVEHPPQAILVGNVIPMENVTLLAGDGGDGKSTIAGQLAGSVVCSANWLGMQVNAQARRCSCRAKKPLTCFGSASATWRAI